MHQIEQWQISGIAKLLKLPFVNCDYVILICVLSYLIKKIYDANSKFIAGALLCFFQGMEECALLILGKLPDSALVATNAALQT